MIQIIDPGSIQESMERLREHITADPSYAYSWHCNLAMAYFDAMPDSFWLPDDGELLKIANDGASRFMLIAFGVITSKNMLDKDE